MTPEQKARRDIDAALSAAGWLVQNRADVNLASGLETWSNAQVPAESTRYSQNEHGAGHWLCPRLAKAALGVEVTNARHAPRSGQSSLASNFSLVTRLDLSRSTLTALRI